MRIAATGFVSEKDGSVSAANALLLRGLLSRGHEVHFFSKPSFVDPRPAIGLAKGFRFFDVTNSLADSFRRNVSRFPGIGFAATQMDAWSYNRLLVKAIRCAHQQYSYDLVLWMGDFARGYVHGIPSVSFAQGAPGTDARSIMRHADQVEQVAGKLRRIRWCILSRLRLSPFGLPPMRYSDHFIVGSSVSLECLNQMYGINSRRISVLPYPIDLDLFNVSSRIHDQQIHSNSLKALWLGRFVPRKRLDLFLDGARQAIQHGCDLRITIVGNDGLIPGYQKLIDAFPFPERLIYQTSIPREEVPKLMAAHDLLCQPSEDENFGSSVAEAQACGQPVIIGPSNGNRDYLAPKDYILEDYSASAVCHAFTRAYKLKSEGNLSDANSSRQLAEEKFSTKSVVSGLEAILKNVAGFADSRKDAVAEVSSLSQPC